MKENKKYVLGIHYGHNATLALLCDGKIVFVQSEERLNRIKNSVGFPHLTLQYIYQHIVEKINIDKCVLFQKTNLGYLYLKQHKFRPFQYGSYLGPHVLKTKWPISESLKWKLAECWRKNVLDKSNLIKDEKLSYFSSCLGIPKHKIYEIDHHEAHAYSVYANISHWGSVLIFTLDGVGDFLSASVRILQKGKFKILQVTDHKNSIGHFYSAVTAMLGMKAGEHEFKVMGLAPYASPKYYEPIQKKLKELIFLNEEGQFQSKYPPTILVQEIEKMTRFMRFDNISGAVQALIEELILKWVIFWIKKTGVQNIAVSGGVFMNVKVCQKIYEKTSIKKYFIMPSAGDESTAIGAAYWGCIHGEKSTQPIPFTDLYLGVEYNDSEIQEAFRKLSIYSRYFVKKPKNIEIKVAQLLAANKVVARCSGRAEFGARALGNRSILANPSDFENIEIINSSIKNRDFWMPFTPSILEEDMQKYLVKSEKIPAPYMAVTFKTTELAKKHLRAAIHPRDKTARPQCVYKKWNPQYYEIIHQFKLLTGIGAVLNTSFNLHGEPSVCSPEDAINTMDNSDLQYLAIGPFLLEKK